MDLTNLSYIKSLLNSHGISPNKLLGQNFLVDASALEKVVVAGELTKADVVLEIGPGVGVLTEQLLDRAGQVFAVERDAELYQVLQKTFVASSNLTLLAGNFLDFSLTETDPKNPLADLATRGFKVISNLPYQITSPVIRRLLGSPWPLELIVLMIQKEVAERITASPGNSSRGFLTIFVEYYAESKIIAQVSKNSFWPVPKVDSAVIKIIPKKKTENIDEKSFFRLVQAGFSSKRKKLANSLAGGLQIDKAEAEKLASSIGMDPNLRAEDLTLDQWITLYKNWSK